LVRKSRDSNGKLHMNNQPPFGTPVTEPHELTRQDLKELSQESVRHT